MKQFRDDWIHGGALDWFVVRRILAYGALALLSACATAPPPPSPLPSAPAPLADIAWPDDSRATQLLVLNRVGFGANASDLRAIESLGTGAYLARQLRPRARRAFRPKSRRTSTG